MFALLRSAGKPLTPSPQLYHESILFEAVQCFKAFMNNKVGCCAGCGRDSAVWPERSHQLPDRNAALRAHAWLHELQGLLSRCACAHVQTVTIVLELMAAVCLVREELALDAMA